MRGDNPIFHAATIFLSAFLLFLVQPVIAKQILPWFGGAAAVWTMCLVFFQTSLLAGYAYSDFVARKLALPTQVKLHAALLVVSLASLPIIPAAHWKPTGNEDPSLQILGMLAATIGLPYFLLSTTSPIVQSWFAKARPGASPYRLFALSNAASMLALVAYPFVLEPWAPTRAQALGSSVGYVAFIALCIAAGWSSLGQKTPVPEVVAPTAPRPRKAKRKGVSAPPAITASEHDVAPTSSRQVLWGILAATGVLLLLAVTNHITQNVASVPLLWILPLALYLSTFILCFDSPGWYRRNVVVVLLAAGLPTMGWALVSPRAENQLGLQIAVFCVGLFLVCMF